MDIYDKLGVTKVINGHATLTRLGGSLMPPEVLAAMTEAAQHFCDIDELHAKVEAKIAEWTQNPLLLSRLQPHPVRLSLCRRASLRAALP